MMIQIALKIERWTNSSLEMQERGSSLPLAVLRSPDLALHANSLCSMLVGRSIPGWSRGKSNLGEPAEN